jgi:nucleotide-binding universal stress UspA family protein
MHHNILVGLDGSSGSSHALECALGQAARMGAHVVGLLVESPLWTAPRYGEHEFVSAVRINAEGLAGQYGVPLEFRVRHGYPAHTIAEQARILGCDLVVLGHAEDSILHRWLTASVSELVRHEAPCRVVVARTGQVIDLQEDTAKPSPSVTQLPISAG